MTDRANPRPSRSTGPGRHCPARHRAPVVLVAMRHPVLRRWTTELLDTACGCWATVVSLDGELLADAIARVSPDVVALDSLDFPACCHAALTDLGREHVVVIGPEPDPAYRQSALDQGAGGWVSQDRIGDDLPRAVWTALGCDRHDCPLRPLMTNGAAPSSRPTGEPS